ncbi:hypothetical protein QZH41_016702 [Actinostola sp. cb2023]|nr:hypothetical protein QZH41_016702 [Actinostola sp. cb2023]
MTIIKQSLANKKDWIYRQVLQKLGVEPPPGNIVMKRSQRDTMKDSKRDNYPHAESSMNVLHGLHSSVSIFKSGEGNKVHDEEGNCYIDEDDFKSFYSPKGNVKDKHFNGEIKPETTFIDCSDITFTPKRKLNFTFHGTNGGVAIDHGYLPKVTGIHSVPRKGQPDYRTQRHIEAKLVGSTYETTGKPIGETTTVEENKWWPPSPESIPDDVMSGDGEGLLKVMTPDDLKAYGLPKQEKMETTLKLETSQEDDDVIVTHVKQDNSLVSNVMEKIQEKDLHDMPPLQLDVHGKPTNYKEILLHYIAQQLKNNPQNPSLQTITNNVASRPRRTMNMDELCKKMLNTRERLEKEQIKWKRKLLSSLEVVLIKKIQRLELETGERAPEEMNLGQVMHQSEQCNGSQSDIVAVMEDLTAESGDVKTARCQITERNTRSVSSIRGYEST